MRSGPANASALAVSRKALLEGLEKHILVRTTAFLLAVAIGYGVSMLLYTGLRRLPEWMVLMRDKVRPFLDMLRILHSGFSG